MNPGEQDAKQRILQAAKRLFARQGFEATSVRQICEEAGANVALVSYHFGGKEQLFRAIYEHYFSPERFEAFDRLKGNPVASLEAFIEALVSYRFEEPEITAISFQEITLESSRSGILMEYLAPVWGLLRRILEEGKELGVFRVEAVQYAMTGIMGMVLFPPKTAFVEQMIEEPLTREGMIRHMTEFAFRLLGVQQTKGGESI